MMQRSVLLAVLALVACTDRLAERATAASAYLGRSEAELVQLAGVPSRAVDAGGRRFVVYQERRVDYLPAPFYGPGPWGWGRPYGPASAVEFVCETNFEIVGGRVAGFSFAGNGC